MNNGKLHYFNCRFNKLGLEKSLVIQWFLVLICGTAGALPFPLFNLGWVAWLVPGLWTYHAIWLMGVVNLKKLLLWGWAVGLVRWLISIYWFIYNPFILGGVASWIALSLYMGFYTGVYYWWVGYTYKLLLGSEALIKPALPLLLSKGWIFRYSSSIILACGWTSLEMISGRVFSGFPWNQIGVSQIPFWPFTWIASWVGVYGISWLIWWSGLIFTEGISHGIRSIVEKSKSLKLPFYLNELFYATITQAWPAIFILALISVGGILKYQKISCQIQQASFFKVAMIQPSIPQRIIFNPTETTNRFEELYNLTLEALKEQPDLIIWPEASLPNVAPELYQRLFNLISEKKVWFIFGATDIEPDPSAKYGYRAYNAAFLCDPNGRIVTVYHKVHLVPFGETIPLEDIFPFMRYFSPLETSLSPGKGPVIFDININGLNIKVCPLICFEDVVPHLVRTYGAQSIDLLVNLTNDGWFGNSAAQWQHAYNAAVRAIENGLPLLRCGNNGLSCWIDPLGRIYGVDFKNKSNEYKPQFKICMVPVKIRAVPTFYNKIGDLFGWICLTIVVLFTVMYTFRKFSKSG